MNGFFNRLLRISLEDKTFVYEEIPDDVLRNTLGGKGLGIHYLEKENPVGVDPLSGDNRFIIAVGPITGTNVWSQSRFAVFAKSPATGGYGESYCGGTAAPRIKGCGVDVLILEGKSPDLCFLTVDEHGVQFHDASHLRGKETYETEDSILADSAEDARSMVIGPAGENRVLCAAIKSDKWRSLGRGGLGAVLGSKNVKGMSFAGKKRPEYADPALLKQVVSTIAKKGKESKATEVYRKFGTPNQVAVTNTQKCFPTRYWQSGQLEGWENLSAEYMREHFDVKRHGCPNCFLQCTKLSVVQEGRHEGLQIEGPEYETIYALGGLNCLDSLEEVAYLNDICDRLGMDTMSAGNLSAFTVEAHSLGKTDFDIDYNQPDRMAELFRMIAHREGFGDTLADGIKSASEQLGLTDLAVHVKGLEPAGFDPRVLKGMGLSYATSPRGACHLRGTFYKAELTGEIAPDAVEGKARLHIDYEDRAALFDSLVLCRFFRDFYGWDELSDLIAGSTGLRLDKTQLELLANSITERTRSYNSREGIGEQEDRLPPRLLDKPNEQGAVITTAEITKLVHDYNDIRNARRARV
ncbi:MAG: aldehyde ferredoxin oxidoreductase family protein [Spirochaetia bacterium]